MRLIVISDIHGNEMIVDSFIKHIMKMKNNFDLLINLGDIVDMFAALHGKDIIEVADSIMKKLNSLKKPMLCIPGNHDPPGIEEIFEQCGSNLHSKRKRIKGIDFIGFGGAETPFNTYFEPTEKEIWKSLEKQFKRDHKIVLLVHNPPRNTKLDRILTGEHVGSLSVRKFIEKHKPILSISGHVHESRGIDKIGKTILFYPGPLMERRYGIVNISGKKVECTEKNF